MVFGLALILALLFGAVSVGLAANGDPFILGKAKNTASRVTGLVKSGAGPALSLKVDSGPPLAVNSSERVANLNAASAGNADTLDNNDSTDFLSAHQNLTTDNIAKSASTLTLDFPSMAPGACSSITSGGLAGNVVSNDIVVVTPDSNIPNQLIVQSRVSTANNTNFFIVLCNISPSTTIDPPPASFNLAVFDQP